MPVLALAIAAPLLVWGQSTGLPTADQIRALTRDVQAARHDDKSDLVLDLDARVRARWGDFETFPLSIVRQESLSVVLTTPFMRYRSSLTAYLKIDRPLADLPWIDGVVVSVEPLRIDAPDVARVVIERGGRAVPPLENQLEADDVHQRQRGAGGDPRRRRTLPAGGRRARRPGDGLGRARGWGSR